VPVVSDLNVAGDFGAVGVAMMQEQFAGAEPAWVEVGQNAAGAAVGGGIGDLIRNQDALNVEPHAARHKQRQQ